MTFMCTNRHAVSTSIPENPNALSPWIQNIGDLSDLDLIGVASLTKAAAIAKPHPTPIVPNVPASNLYKMKIMHTNNVTYDVT